MFSIFKQKKYYFYSEKNLEDCVDILDTQIDKPHISLTGGFRGRSEVLGSIYGETFRVFRKREYRQSFTPICKGVLKSTSNNGTIIEISFSLSDFGIIAAIFMYSTLTLILLAISSFNMINIIKNKDSFINYAYLLICLCLIIFLTTGISVTKVVSSEEESFFINFFE